VTPIILLHGWGLTGRVWTSLRAELAAADMPTLAPDLFAAEGSLDDWAARLLDEIPAGAVLVGWSLGAMLAMAIAATTYLTSGIARCHAELHQTR
jgi:pimeloyl-ACP methyl ester carboxylesterase